MMILDLALLLLLRAIWWTEVGGKVMKNVSDPSNVLEANVAGGLDITWLARCVKS
jgi:hypothetical protein